jgi:hypothetical protein
VVSFSLLKENDDVLGIDCNLKKRSTPVPELIAPFFPKDSLSTTHSKISPHHILANRPRVLTDNREVSALKTQGKRQLRASDPDGAVSFSCKRPQPHIRGVVRENRAFTYEIQHLCSRINNGELFTKERIQTIWEATEAPGKNADNNELREIADAIYSLSGRLSTEDPLQLNEILDLWEEATAAEKTLLTLERATAEAEGFVFPSDVSTSDMKKFESVGWDFTGLVRMRIQELPSDRLNESAIRTHIDPLDPDFERLLSISRGVRVVTAPDFEPNRFPPPLRKKYVSLQSPPINKTIYKNFVNGKTIILPMEALDHILDAHFSLVHCNLEATKLRLITDSSNAPEGQHPLNSLFVKEDAKKMWGPITPVDIDTIIVKIVHFMLAYPDESWELFKMDMKAAFSLFTMFAEDVHLLGFGLTDNLIQFEITGSFGKTDYPYVFNIFTNVVRREVTKRLLDAIIDMYVDDIMGISIAGDRLSENLTTIKLFVESVWGRGSIEDEKTKRSLSSLDMIGYEVNIVERVVRMSQSNRYKTIRVFARVKEDIGITIVDLMRVASYATRYTKICPVMAPFTCHVYNMLTWRSNLHRQLKLVVKGDKLSADCKRTIQLWRCVITMMELRKEDARFFRTFASFMPQLDSYFQIEFDASLEGAGVIVSQWVKDQYITRRVIRVRYPYVLDDMAFKSSIQNTCEFIAATIGLACAIKLGARDGHMRLKGDSKTALRWAETWSFRSGPSNNAAIVYVALGLRYHLRLDDIVFVRGIDNKTCDRLSREHHPSELGFEESLYSDTEDADMSRLVALCTPPSTGQNPEEDFVSKWVEAASFADSLEESSYEL